MFFVWVTVILYSFMLFLQCQNGAHSQTPGWIVWQRNLTVYNLKYLVVETSNQCQQNFFPPLHYFTLVLVKHFLWVRGGLYVMFSDLIVIWNVCFPRTLNMHSTQTVTVGLVPFAFVQVILTWLMNSCFDNSILSGKVCVSAVPSPGS